MPASLDAGPYLAQSEGLANHFPVDGRQPDCQRPRGADAHVEVRPACRLALELGPVTDLTSCSDVDTAAQNINVFNAAFKRSQVAAGLDHLVARIPNALQDLSVSRTPV